jgi:hypothetical protein
MLTHALNHDGSEAEHPRLGGLFRGLVRKATEEGD